MSVVARALSTLLFVVVSTNASPAPSGGVLGQFQSHSDIGSPSIPGAATYNAASQEYRITSGGRCTQNGQDQFHFAWKRMQGDFILHARIELTTGATQSLQVAGWMARSSLDADSPYVTAVVRGDGLAALYARRTKGAESQEIRLPGAGSDVIQLQRTGNTYTISATRFGDPFSSRELADFPAQDATFAGLFYCTHNPAVTGQVAFHNVRVIAPAKQGFVPYRDYIGTHLELLDVHTGRREIIHSSALPFEAPNWTPDGAALIYNSSGGTDARGRLYRFDLATRRPLLIETGFAIRNNNDHVLSFDGSMLAISDQSTDAGESTIFTVPVQGGTPKRITPLTPSYLHGWSPDAKFLVYTGGRKGEFDIYKIPSDGSGPEVRLTSAKGVDDGPEYSPDGKYIYFNSVRSGRMQIWRMKPDGSQQERVTHDEYNNWFPHISPDGKWLSMLSYGDDVAPAEHPYYKHVYLRLMPIEGGTPKVIAYVYGGQGTINVPSWSPDSRMLAFVSNSGIE